MLLPSVHKPKAHCFSMFAHAGDDVVAVNDGVSRNNEDIVSNSNDFGVSILT